VGGYMKISNDSIKPIYIQIAEGIEDDILHGILKEEESAYSQYQLANMFKLNPATAAKGINLLVGEGILFKKRGLGMFVANGAKETILKKRKVHFEKEVLSNLLHEARILKITKDELKEMIDKKEMEESS
jgi:GntR family transcriptional regulator